MDVVKYLGYFLNLYTIIYKLRYLVRPVLLFHIICSRGRERDRERKLNIPIGWFVTQIAATSVV